MYEVTSAQIYISQIARDTLRPICVIVLVPVPSLTEISLRIFPAVHIKYAAIFRFGRSGFQKEVAVLCNKLVNL